MGDSEHDTRDNVKARKARERHVVPGTGTTGHRSPVINHRSLPGQARGARAPSLAPHPFDDYNSYNRVTNSVLAVDDSEHEGLLNVGSRPGLTGGTGGVGQARDGAGVIPVGLGHFTGTGTCRDKLGAERVNDAFANVHQWVLAHDKIGSMIRQV
ncbi:hypothetical protein BC834DRAFT_839724 [Gloeopeniophorella convolvens]|nr:hypothetical protein BC834DRAFT_839724 [Gloeopeniophorella convolvens]